MNTTPKNYLVTVIIPTFNGSTGLKNAIQSIINQSIGFKNIELIIVDDASTDNITKKIILKYKSQYPNNIKPIFLDKNSGYPGKSRNIGVEHSTSDYIIFLDDDDIYLENGIETLYQAINQYNSDLIIANSYTHIKGEYFINIKNLKENIININPTKNQKNFDILAKNVCSWSKIHKKKFIQKYNIKHLENHYSEDVYFYLDILKNSKKITILPQDIVYVYNENKNSIMHNHNLNFCNNIIKATYIVANPLKNSKLNLDIIFNCHIITILTIFLNSNATKTEKKETFLKIYELEKYLEKQYNYKKNLKRIEMKILNNLIMQKKFKKTIILSNFYKKLYNNKLIQKIFYKLNWGE